MQHERPAERYAVCLRGLALTSAIVVLSLAFCSCNKGNSNSTSQVPSVPVEYPDGWPLADLVVPGTATGNGLYGCGEGIDGQFSGYMKGSMAETWALGFTTRDSWDVITAHFDQVLKDMDFGVVEDRPMEELPGLLPGLGKGQMAWKRYCSVDLTIMAEVSYFRDGAGKVDGYILKIVDFGEPQTYFRDDFRELD